MAKVEKCALCGRDAYKEACAESCPMYEVRLPSEGFWPAWNRLQRAIRGKVLAREWICPRDLARGRIAYVGRSGCGTCEHCRGAVRVEVREAPARRVRG